MGQTTLIAPGSTWKYFDQGSDLGTAWRNPAFDDSSWPSGPALLGYGNDNESTIVDFGGDASNKFVTTYFRKTFIVDDPPSAESMELSLLYDDGLVAYLNGTEVARANMPATYDFNTFAASIIGGTAESSYDLTLVTNLLVAGENVLAVEVHQASRSSSDLAFDLGAGGLNATFAAVPEPGTTVLASSGLAWLLVLSGRRFLRRSGCSQNDDCGFASTP
jgi:hypothetical protein